MEQNLLLKHRVEVLEGTVANMKKEMGAVKSALGPWFHRAKTTAANAGGVTRTLGGIHLQPETSERRRSRTEDDAGLGDESGGLENGGNAASNGNGVERMMASSRLPLEDGHDATTTTHGLRLRNDGSRTEDSGYLPEGFYAAAISRRSSWGAPTFGHGGWRVEYSEWGKCTEPCGAVGS